MKHRPPGQCSTIGCIWGISPNEGLHGCREGRVALLIGGAPGRKFRHVDCGILCREPEGYGVLEPRGRRRRRVRRGSQAPRAAGRERTERHRGLPLLRVLSRAKIQMKTGSPCALHRCPRSVWDEMCLVCGGPPEHRRQAGEDVRES